MKSKEAESTHYLGAEGEEYFNWQRESSRDGGIIEAKVFRTYISGGDCVLDFGCGGGYVLKHLSCRRRIGVEINPAARHEAALNGVECYASLADLPEELAVDVAISNHALEHVRAPVEVLAELRRRIKPNGVLVLKLPIDDWRTQRRIEVDDINHHLHTWTPQLLFNCLKEAGFGKNAMSLRVYTHAWFPGAAERYERMPEFLFDFGCRLYAMLKKRRQLIAVAYKTAGAPAGVP